jgi:hypothetical protein
MGCFLHITPHDKVVQNLQKSDLSSEVTIPVTSNDISTIEKGDFLEAAVVDVMTQDPNVICIYKGGGSGSLDPVFYYKKSGQIIITECKNYGSKNSPGYVSAKSETAIGYNRLATNVGKMMESVRNNPNLSEEIKKGVQESLLQGKGTFLTVIGEHSRSSRDLMASAQSQSNHFIMKISFGESKMPKFTNPF